MSRISTRGDCIRRGHAIINRQYATYGGNEKYIYC